MVFVNVKSDFQVIIAKIKQKKKNHVQMIAQAKEHVTLQQEVVIALKDSLDLIALLL